MSLGLKIEVVCEAANYTKIGDLLKYIGLPSAPRNLGPKPTLYSGQWAKNPQQTNFSGRKKRGAFKGPIRIPSNSPVFLFSDLVFFRISAKSLKFQSLLFSIPTAARDLRIVSSNQAVATTTDYRSIISLHPATIRIDKNAHCTVRRSRLRVSSFPNFLELQCNLRQATLALTMLTFRIALMSRIGGWPKTRLYSRVNWLTLS